ncbi:MAG: tripartite tricarboxylate transporter TctB family protein [Hyphomicrobiaceae bacterium]
MNLRRDHIAGGAFVVAGAGVLAGSGDLPLGTLASPGAGMMPTLVIGLMIAFGLVLLARAGTSPPLRTLAWTELPHALCVGAAATAAVAFYTTLGFLLTMALLLFGLLFVVERRPLLHAAVFGIGGVILVYRLFVLFLKTPLPRGVIGY